MRPSSDRVWPARHFAVCAPRFRASSAWWIVLSGCGSFISVFGIANELYSPTKAEVNRAAKDFFDRAKIFLAEIRQGGYIGLATQAGRIETKRAIYFLITATTTAIKALITEAEAVEVAVGGGGSGVTLPISPASTGTERTAVNRAIAVSRFILSEPPSN